MSTQIASIFTLSEQKTELQITRFSGGKSLGTMLQLTQGLGHGVGTLGYIQLTKSDVEELVPILTKWLKKEAK